ncbi:MAG TPA: DUF87 domain-containing protein [Candidatus Lokiarchaeia archaeon]|nr:DUF87 domain-containing protein [Candidatus Lokiarchaeia archaeon]
MLYEKVWIGYLDYEEPTRFEVEPSLFLKHAGIFGSTGSGKTVLGKILIEEMALQGIPSIVIDPQGDIASLIIPNDDDILQEKGVDLDRKNDFFNSSEIRVFTPSSNKGLPISLNPVIFPPFDVDQEEAVRILDNVASTLVELLVKLVKFPPAKVVQSKSVIYTILLEKWNQNKHVENLEHLSNLIQEDEEFYQKFMNKTEKDKLVISLNNLLIGSTGLLFSGKAKLDIGSLLEKHEDRTPINIFFLKSLLNESEKHLFISILIQALYSWMIQQGSPSNINCFFYMDEMAPFMPAGMSTPPGKAMLLLLLRQARKYGVSCVLASQSPKDIDYHGLDQINSFFFGRILSEQSQKLIKNLLGSKLDPEKLEAMANSITLLTTGQFVGFLPDLKDENIVHFKTRYLFSKHITLTEADLKKMLHPDMPDEEQSPPEENQGDDMIHVIDEEPNSSQESIPKKNPIQDAGPSIISIEDATTQESQPDEQQPQHDQESMSPGSPMQVEPITPQKKSLEEEPRKQEIFRFKSLPEKMMEDIIKRTVEYDYFEKLVNITKLQKFIDLPKYNTRIYEYVKKFLDKFEYEPEIDEISQNGLPLLIYQKNSTNIIVASMIGESKTKVGILGAFSSDKAKSQLDKLLEGIAEIVKKVKL